MPWNREKLDRIFDPGVVAVVGARRVDGYTWLRHMSDFTGKLYSVQIDPNDTAGIVEMGIPNYKSLVEIPEPVDYVVVAVPRRVAPIVLKDAIAKGVKAVHMFTSGFAESDDEGAQLEQQITQMALEAGLVIVGPNCMGIFNPDVGMRFSLGQDVSNKGSVTIISQSGGLASTLIHGTQASGIGINKGVSFGNGIVLDSPDLLEYFAADPKTTIICAYIEGTRDGPRFFQALRGAASRKPVILLKGGQTEAGQRMSASHTGSLATSKGVWDAMVRQAGAIGVDSFDDAVDMIKALSYLTPTTGNGVGIMGGSGGQSVTMSDDFARAGLRVPTLSQPTLEMMSNFFQLIGASYFNPLDTAGGGLHKAHLESIVDLLAMDSNIDAVAIAVAATAGRRPHLEVLQELEIYQNAKDHSGKPIMAMFQEPIPYGEGTMLEEVDKKLQELGIPVFLSPERAARALSRMVDYYAARHEMEELN